MEGTEKKSIQIVYPEAAVVKKEDAFDTLMGLPQ
jgi:hypothetical protein